MGKKSVVDSERLPSEEDSTMKAIEAALIRQQVEPADLYQEMLKIALQTHLDSQEIRPKVPVRSETELLILYSGLKRLMEYEREYSSVVNYFS